MSKKKQQKEDPTQILLQKGELKEAQTVLLQSLESDIQFEKLNDKIILQYLKQSSINQIIEQNQNMIFKIYGLQKIFKVCKINYNQEQNQEDHAEIKYIITKNTQISFLEIQQNPNEEQKEEQQSSRQINNSNEIKIKILENEVIIQIQNLIDSAIQKKKILKDNNLPPIKGLILHGQSGVGKTTLINQIGKNLLGICFVFVQCSEIPSRVVGDGEKKLENIFRQIDKLDKCVLVLEDIDQIANKNESSLLKNLCNLIDKIDSEDNVLVIGITQDLSKLDSQITRSGRLDKLVKMELPKPKERLLILTNILEGIKKCDDLSEDDIEEISSQLHGFGPSDIFNLIRNTILENPEKSLTKQQMLESLQTQQPMIQNNDIIMEIPKVLWSEIGGYSKVKSEIKQVIEWPLKHPESFKKVGIEPSKGILLYGPPGCSKTMVAKAIATESKLNFLAVKGPELFSKYVGDSEKAIRDIFKRARACAPSVIFFDEIDAIATQRSINTDVSERVLCQLLNEMDGIEGLKQVIIVAATNRPDIIDKALTRPGRFDHLIYVPPPSEQERHEILKIQTNKMPLSEDIDLLEISKRCNGFSGAEICLVCRQAGLNALSRDINTEKVIKEDFIEACKKVKPRITQAMINEYIKFAEDLKFF